MIFVKTEYGAGPDDDRFRIIGLPKGMRSIGFTAPYPHNDNLYKEVMACIPKEEYLKALLLGHRGALRARRYFKEEV